MKRIIITFTIFLLSTFLLSAKGIEVSSYVNKTTLGIDEELILTFEVRGEDISKVGEPEIPSFDRFELIGTSSSSSTSINIINGKMTREVTKQYTYTLQPTEIGTAIIPSIKVKYKGKELSTNVIKVTITKASDRARQRPSPSSGRSKPTPSQKLGDNIFIEVLVSKQNVMLGESITVSYKLYSTYDLQNISPEEMPTFKGFYKEETYQAQSISPRIEVKKGRRFYSMLLNRFTLFPTQEGHLSITPMKLICTIELPPKNWFDFGSTKRVRVNSRSIYINVKPLPIEGRPDNFKDAVGEFHIQASVNKNVVKAGDALTYTMIISGSGNIKMLQPPKLEELPNFRIFDPEIRNEISATNAGIDGRKIVKYLIVPLEKGNYTIPAVIFPYYDPGAHKYVVKHTEPIDIVVEKSDKKYILSGKDFAKRDIKILGTDIAFIKLDDNIKNFRLAYESPVYILLLLLSLLSIPIVLIYQKDRERRYVDSGYLRSRMAKKILRKYLQQAEEERKKGNTKAFFADAENGLVKYITDKLNISCGATTRDELISLLQKNNIEKDSVEMIKDFFNFCDLVRFSPQNFSQTDIEEQYEKLKKIIKELTGKKLKRVR